MGEGEETHNYDVGVGSTLFEAAAAILLFSVSLIIVLIFANHLIGQKWNANHALQVPESGVTMLVGIGIGGLLKLGSSFTNDSSAEESIVVFSPAIFFLGLLPPIIFNEGHHLDKSLFFAHLTPILVVVFLGTAVASVVLALMIHYGAEMTGVEEGISMPEAVAFGSLMSATDPVAILAAFCSLRVEVTLFFVVFGEAVLNDAVSLTMFHIASGFVGTEQGPEAVGIGIMVFCIIIVGSTIIGYLCGVAMALALKKANMRQTRVLELALYSTLVYLPYMLAQVMGMSGIVAILIAGVTSRHYAYNNLSSDDNRDLADFIFRFLAFLTENATFLYLGISVCGVPAVGASFNAKFIMWTFLACLLSRAVAVFGLCTLMNAFSCCTGMYKIGWRSQVVVWFAGLRGAVAFAAVSVFPDEEGNRDLMRTTTISVIVLFTFIVAPWTVPLLRALKIPMNVDYRTIVVPPRNKFYQWLADVDEKWVQPRLLRKQHTESELELLTELQAELETELPTEMLTHVSSHILPSRAPRHSRQITLDMAMTVLREAGMETVPAKPAAAAAIHDLEHGSNSDNEGDDDGGLVAVVEPSDGVGGGSGSGVVESSFMGPPAPNLEGEVERWIQDSVYDFGQAESPRQPSAATAFNLRGSITHGSQRSRGRGNGAGILSSSQHSRHSTGGEPAVGAVRGSRRLRRPSNDAGWAGAAASSMMTPGGGGGDLAHSSLHTIRRPRLPDPAARNHRPLMHNTLH